MKRASGFGRDVLTDATFWLDVADTHEPGHEAAVNLTTGLARFNVFVPWPVVYEALRTRMVRNAEATRRLSRAFDVLHVRHVDDAPYRERALSAAGQDAVKGARALSLVDRVVRAIIQEGRVRFRYLITRNPNDFRDVCAKTGVEIIDTAADLEP
jgi:predicted nucleic acid-binding protein